MGDPRVQDDFTSLFTDESEVASLARGWAIMGVVVGGSHAKR